MNMETFNKFKLLKQVALSGIDINENTKMVDLNDVLRMPKPVMENPTGVLLPEQLEITNVLSRILRENKLSLNSSSAGSGKTHTTCELARRFKLPLFVLCPKAVIKNWYETAKEYGVPIITITNYEMIRNNDSDSEAKWYDMRNGFTNVATICPWIKKKKSKTGSKFVWNLPYRCFIVADEEHCAKNSDTINFSLIKGAIKTVREGEHKMLLLSATPIEKKNQLKTILYFLGLIRRPKMDEVNRFFRSTIQSTDLNDIHEFLYDKERGVIASMSELIPMMEVVEGGEKKMIKVINDVRPVTYEMDELTTQKIIEKNQQIMELRKKIGSSKGDHSLGEMNANRRLVEIYKIPKMVELAIDALKNDRDGKGPFKRVTIFVNFVDSVEEIYRRLSKALGNTPQNKFIETIYGNQGKDETDDVIKRYSLGQTRILIATISKAGTGINLHDARGDLETFVIISPPTSATLLTQSIRRHYRAMIKSHVTQVIVFTKGDAIEESIRDALVLKMNDISNFTAGKNTDFELDALAKHYPTNKSNDNNV